MALSVNSTSSTTHSGSGSFSFNHTISGSNTLLIVITHEYGSTTSSVTFNGTSLTKITGASTSNGSHFIAFWYLINPDSGTHSVTVNSGSILAKVLRQYHLQEPTSPLNQMPILQSLVPTLLTMS